jgi:hypothetical protein
MLPLLKEVESKFDLSDVKNKEGLSDKYLSYHFKVFFYCFCGKSSTWQNDINKAESVYSSALGKLLLLLLLTAIIKRS